MRDALASGLVVSTSVAGLILAAGLVVSVSVAGPGLAVHPAVPDAAID